MARRRADLDLGMDDWHDEETEEKENDNPEPGPKKLRLSVSVARKKKAASLAVGSRYNFLDEEEKKLIAVKFVPENTAKSTKWALTNFTDWSRCRRERFSDTSEHVPDGLLSSGDSSELCKWLSLFTAETRKKDGSKYPPKSIYILLTGLLRHMRSLNASCPNFLDTENKDFTPLHDCMDNVFRRLRTEGVGSSSKSAEVFTEDDQRNLWEKGVLGRENPKSLLRTVFFLNGKNFCLRGGEEHRALKLSQVKRFSNPDRYEYTEHVSKNRAGGLRQLRVTSKVVPVYSVPEVGEKCHVSVLDFYLSKLPPDAATRDVFYLTPLANVPKDATKPWFSPIPVGRNTLSTMVRGICSDGNILGNKTNHSLRATGTSALFNAGVPEKVIQQRSGHLSLKGLRQYERVTEDQQQAACQILAATKAPTTVTGQQQCAQVTPLGFTPQMNFSSCTVNIFQGGTSHAP